MNRRQASGNIAALMGAMLISPAIFEACKKAEKDPLKGVILNEEQIVFLDELSDTMIPDTTDSPGAKAAGNGKEMATIIKNCYKAEDGEAFIALLNEFNGLSRKEFGKNFIELSHEERIKVITPKDRSKEETYVKLKELAVFVYFTSEIGMNKALRYLEVPGKYDGSAEYKAGDKAWAWSFFSY